MVRRFIAGDRLEDALLVLERLRERGLRWTVDVLGESVSSREMAAAAADRYLATLDALAERGLEANVSLKLTQMGLDVDPDFCRDENVGRVVDRAREIGPSCASTWRTTPRRMSRSRSSARCTPATTTSAWSSSPTCAARRTTWSD
jgi:proline dehydrogenase